MIIYNFWFWSPYIFVEMKKVEHLLQKTLQDIPGYSWFLVLLDFYLLHWICFELVYLFNGI